MTCASRSQVFLRAALPPSQCLTERTADRRDQRRFTARPGPARRLDRPSGGTEEFLGRLAARSGSHRAQAKGTLADLRYVFGAAARSRRQPQEQNLPVQPQGKAKRDSFEPSQPDHEKRDYLGCAP
jgi:hypothetical protein